MDKFGEYIRRLRIERGFNQTQLAAKVGLDSGGLSKIETGKKNLKEDKLQILSEVFNLSLDEIKMHYFSDKFANECIKNKCPDNVFLLAKEKVKYFQNTRIKQGKLNL